MCEVMEVSDFMDVSGHVQNSVPCGQPAIEECSDCLMEVCKSHSEFCEACDKVFCESCYSFHRRMHYDA